MIQSILELGLQLLAFTLFSGVLFFITNRVQTHFENIEYREREDGTVYRTDGQPCWWNK